MGPVAITSSSRVVFTERSDGLNAYRAAFRDSPEHQRNEATLAY